MRRVLWVLISAGVVLGIAWLLSRLSSHVSLTFGSIAVDAPAAVAVLAAVIGFAVLYAVVRLLGTLLRTPRVLGNWQTARHRRLGDLAVTHTLLALAAGEKAEARREAARARRLLGDTPQTLILAAEAARLAGREDEAETAFRLLTARSDAAFLGLRGLFRQAIARDDWDEAAALVRQAEAVQPGAAWLRAERAQLALRAGNWAEALSLIEAEAPRAALAAAAADAEADPRKALRLAQRAWKDDPRLAPATLAYASRLRASGREARAQAVIRQSWSLAPHPELATFALAPVSDRLARVQAARRLTEVNPTDMESYLLLARTALEAGLTGEARRYATTARDAGGNGRALWLLFADLADDSEAGRLEQRDALRHAAAAEPDPGWRCVECHIVSPTWRAACPVCNTAGGLRWGPRTATLPTILTVEDRLTIGPPVVSEPAATLRSVRQPT
jgi:HemY protein